VQGRNWRFAKENKPRTRFGVHARHNCYQVVGSAFFWGGKKNLQAKQLEGTSCPVEFFQEATCQTEAAGALPARRFPWSATPSRGARHISVMLRTTYPPDTHKDDSRSSPSVKGEDHGPYQKNEFAVYGSPRLQHPLASSPATPHESHVPVQEYHNAFVDAKVSSRPSSHHRQQSLPALLPFAIKNSSRANSPERRAVRPSTPVEMPLTGDGRRGSKAPDISRGNTFAGWFSGMTPPRDGNQRGSMPAQHNAHSPATDLPSRNLSPTTSRFASLASTISANLSRLTQSPISPTDEDELLSLDIERGLFPSGPPTERDTFSPAAFKNLQTNATGLLVKMQVAYRQRVHTLRDLESEKGAQRDELEEAETRAQHLKMQLEGMARRAAYQEAEMRALAEELAAEKKARAHEKMMREKGISALPPAPAMMSEGSMISEDLGIDDRRGWRKSLKSDGSYDTDEESFEEESMFSRSRSPTIAPTPFDSGSVADGPVSHPRVAALGNTGRPRPAPAMSTFQKIVKNVTSALKEDEEDGDSGPGCRNCKGQDASIAWNTVSLLRDENKHLKQRVGQLETAVEGALDLANGIGLDSL
jgi:hypothetical protein